MLTRVLSALTIRLLSESVSYTSKSRKWEDWNKNKWRYITLIIDAELWWSIFSCSPLADPGVSTPTNLVKVFTTRVEATFCWGCNEASWPAASVLHCKTQSTAELQLVGKFSPPSSLLSFLSMLINLSAVTRPHKYNPAGQLHRWMDPWNDAAWSFLIKQVIYPCKAKNARCSQTFFSFSLYVSLAHFFLPIFIVVHPKIAPPL